MFPKKSIIPNQEKRRFLNQLIISFVLLFVICQLLSLQSFFGLRAAYVRSLTRLQTNISSSIAASIDDMLGEIFQANYVVSLDKDVQTAFSSPGPLTGENYYIFPQVIRTLSSVTAYSDLIEGIAIYRRSDGLVVSDKAVYQDEEYFQNFHRYEDYDLAFWKNITNEQKAFTMLKSTKTFSYMDRNSTMLLPVIYSGSFGPYSDSLFIIDLNYSSIQKNLDRFRTTANSEIFVISDSRSDLLFSSSSACVDVVPELALEQQEESVSFQRKLNGKKTIVIIQRERLNLQEIRVATLIPQQDVTFMLQKSSKVILWLSITFNVVVALLLIRILSRHVYSPVQQLLQYTTGDQPIAGENEFEVLKRIYANAENIISNTRTELQRTMCIAREQVLRKALLGREFSPAEKDYIRRNAAGGDTSYRMVTIQPVYKQAIYEDFSPDFTINTLDLIKTVVNVMFSFCDIWILEMESDQLVLFLGGVHSEQEPLVYSACQQIIQIFQEDEQYLCLLIYLDTKDVRLPELSQYYKEMTRGINGTPPAGRSRIVNCTDRDDSDEIVLPADEENKIINLLASGKKEDARRWLETVFDHCIQGGFSGTRIFNMVMQLYFAGTKALSRHGLTMDSQLNQSFSEFVAGLQNKSLDVIRIYLCSFFSQVADRCASVDVPLNMKLFSSYLDENYNKDLSLDMLAEKYNTSAQYISRLIKKEVGMTYQSYLNHLRITKAQELLVSTDLSITEIYEQVGYNSRNTFVKTFKSMTGVTPSDYRRTQTKNRK